MTNTTDHGAPWHESIGAFRARRGRPVDHPAVDHLIEVVGRRRWTAPTEEVALARARSERPGATTDRHAEAIDRWALELLEDGELADWFLAGLPDEQVEREEAATLDLWDRSTRPWAAAIVVAREPYRCAISGRTDGTLALRLTPRSDGLGDALLIHPAEILGICHRGLTLVAEGLELVERMDPSIGQDRA